jgi:hypothetical protein
LDAIIVDAVFPKGKDRLDVRLVADVANPGLVGTNANVVYAVVIADIVLKRFQFHHPGAPPPVVGG